MASTPGWYGKLPALGDFARRRLPAGFIEPWDAWLQKGMAASRAALGQDWLAHYLSAPIWRFALLPGVIGPDAWAGVLLPSVDRVGRYFPLTVCASLPAAEPLGPSLAALDDWLARLEQAALLGLDPERGLERLEAALLNTPAVPLAPAGGDETATAPAFLDSLAARVLAQTLAGCTLWWSPGPSGTEAGFVEGGLPPPERHAELLRGRPD